MEVFIGKSWINRGRSNINGEFSAGNGNTAQKIKRNWEMFQKALFDGTGGQWTKPPQTWRKGHAESLGDIDGNEVITHYNGIEM